MEAEESGRRVEMRDRRVEVKWRAAKHAEENGQAEDYFRVTRKDRSVEYAQGVSPTPSRERFQPHLGHVQTQQCRSRLLGLWTDEIAKHAGDEEEHEVVVVGCLDLFTELRLLKCPCRPLAAAVRGVRIPELWCMLPVGLHWTRVLDRCWDKVDEWSAKWERDV